VPLHDAPHVVCAPATQLPAPSQVLAAVCVLLLHDGAPQLVAAA